MGEFINDVEWQFEEYCKVAEKYGFIDLAAKKTGFRCTSKSGEFNAGWISFTGGITATRDYQQSKIEQLEKKLNAVTNLLNDLKTERKDFKEFDLYDKGYRVTTDYIIRDLEKALRGECE